MKALGAALGLLAPSAAWACPACAARAGGGAATALLVGGLIAVPYTLAVVVWKVVRRLEKDRPGR